LCDQVLGAGPEAASAPRDVMRRDTTSADYSFHSVRLWLPSQNGLFCELPQRHKACAGFVESTAIGLPWLSNNSIVPSTNSGPLGRQRIFTFDILASRPF
jgi:hypothetical protein